MAEFAPKRSAAAIRKEIETLLVQAEQELRASSRLAAEAEQAPVYEGLLRFGKFRQKVGDFQALHTIIDERVDSMGDDFDAELRLQADKLDAMMLMLIVNASTRFFEKFAKAPSLPLGAQEHCREELKRLEDAHTKLQRPEYEGERGTELRQELERVTVLLRDIIDRTPALRDFG